MKEPRFRAFMERLFGHSIINGIFLDELKEETGRCNPIVADCGLFCEMPTTRKKRGEHEKLR